MNFMLYIIHFSSTMEQDWTPRFELEGATVRRNEMKFKKPLYEDGVGSAIYLASIRGKEFVLSLVKYSISLYAITDYYLNTAYTYTNDRMAYHARKSSRPSRDLKPGVFAKRVISHNVME